MDNQSRSVAIEQTELNGQALDLSQHQRAQSAYRYWRIRTMYSLIFGYATFYLVRLNFPNAIPAMCEEFGYTKTEMGYVISLFSIVYGAGKFINGHFSDRSNARYFMTIGLIGSAVASLCTGFGNSLSYFCVFWVINAWFQSMAWPPCGRLLAHWFAPKELGTKWGLWNSSHQIGGASIYVLSGFLITHFGWRSAFFVPAAIAFAVSFLLFNRLRDTPKSLGLPAVEVYKGLAEREEDPEEKHLTHKELIYRVLCNKLLWYVCIGNMFLYIVRMGVVIWAPTFLNEFKGSSPLTSGWQTAGFEIAGLFGGIYAGWLSDKVFHGRRGPVSVIYMIGLVLALFYFWKVPKGHVFLDAMAMIAVGFMVYGPQVLVGVAAADFSSNKAVGMATGLTGTFGYIGAAISGVGVGYIADHWGWSGGFMFFIVCAMLGVTAFSLTWNHRAKVLENR